MLENPHPRDEDLNFACAIKKNPLKKPLDEKDFASMVKSLLVKGSEDNLDERQMMRYVNQLAGGETKQAKIASIQGFVTRLAFDALKTSQGVAVRITFANLFQSSLPTPTAKAT